MRDTSVGKDPGVCRIPGGSSPLGHPATHLTLKLVNELLETVDLEPPLHLSF